MIKRRHRYGVCAAALLLALLCLLPLNACTKPGVSSAENARQDLLAYYEQLGEEGLTDQTQALVLLLAGGAVSQETVERLIPVSDQALPIQTLCSEIYLTEAARLDSRSYRGQNLVALLTQRQLEDGSFRFLEETVRAAMTLENVGASYNREGVVRLLIAAQRPDGGFCVQEGGETDLVLTGLTLSLLTCFEEDYRATTMLERATEYLKTLSAALPQPQPDCAALSALLCGLVDAGQDVASTELVALLEALLSCRTETGAFSAQPEHLADVDSTSAALAALEAIHYGKSWWNSAILRSGVVSLSIVEGDEVIHQASRFVLQEGETALSLTSRFCAANDIDIEYQMGSVLSIGETTTAGGRAWNLSVNGQEASVATTLAPGDEVVWQFS